MRKMMDGRLTVLCGVASVLIDRMIMVNLISSVPDPRMYGTFQFPSIHHPLEALEAALV